MLSSRCYWLLLSLLLLLLAVVAGVADVAGNTHQFSKMNIFLIAIAMLIQFHNCKTTKY